MEKLLLLFKNVSPRQTVFKNTFWLFLSQVIAKVLRLVLFLYAARILGPEKYGNFAYVFSIASIFFIFADFGVVPLLVREYQQRKDKLRYLQVGFWLKTSLGFISTLIAVFGLLAFSSLELKQIFILLILMNLLANLREFAIGVFNALQRMEKEFLITFIDVGTTTVLGILFLIIKPTSVLLAVAYLLGTFISFIVAFVLIRQLISSQPAFDPVVLKYYLVNGLPLVLFGLLGYVYFTSDQILLGYLRGTGEVGYYAIVTKMILTATVLPNLFLSSLFPYLSAKVADKRRLKEIFRTVSIVFILLAISIASTVTIVAPLVVTWILGNQYLPAVKLTQIMIWILLLIFPTLFYYQLLLVSNQQWQYFWVTLSAASVNIILGLALIPTYGMYGAVTSTFIAQLLNSTLSFRLVYKFLK